MVTKKVDLEGCPVEKCDDEVTIALVTTKGTKLKRQNLVHDMVCLCPTKLDGEPAAYIIYHEEIEPTKPDPELASTASDVGQDGGGEGNGPSRGEVVEKFPGPDLDDNDNEEGGKKDETEEDLGPDPKELTGEHEIVYNKIVEETASGGSVLLATIKGKCLNTGMSQSRVGEVAEELIERGYIYELERGVYKKKR